MKDKIQIDIGVGDVVKPQYRKFQLFHYRGQPFFEASISLNLYPIEFIFSEKLETLISKCSKNSRMKDYHDLLILVRNFSLIESETLKQAITETFKNRGTSLTIIHFDSNGIKSVQKLWVAHLNGLGDVAKDLDLPKNIETVIEEINQQLVAIH